MKLYGNSSPINFKFDFYSEMPITKNKAVAKTEPYTANEVPQPQVVEALGLVNVNPLLFNPP